MKKIIILFLIFSGIVFAKWEVGNSYTTSGHPTTTFTTYDLEESGSIISVGVNVESFGFSTVTIFHENIEKEDNSIVLIVTDNDGSDINCRFHEDDVEDYGIRVSAGRSSVLTKIIYNGKSAKLMKNFKPIATFDLKGIKQIMQKHVGSSYWYKYELND